MKEQIETEVSLEIVPSKKRAMQEKCRKICETYLQLARMPHVMHDKARRLQIACMIKRTRQLYLS